MGLYGEEQIGKVLGERYRLEAVVGAGAVATVYRATDTQLRRRVAVKVLHPSLADDAIFRRHFEAEAKASAGLTHPNIVAVFDWGVDRRMPYLVYEYLGGGSLRALLDRGPLSPSQTLSVGLDACKGLDYAHRKGFVHRDIKPANLVFGDDGRLRIADFGLARAIAEAAWTEPAGMVVGTARYASPEQAKGLAVDGKSDVYSLALTLIEAATGEVPFAGDTTITTLMNRVDRLMPVSAELGPLASVLEKAGRPDPAERSSAAELGKGLVEAAQRLPRPEPLDLPSGAGRAFDIRPQAPAVAPPPPEIVVGGHRPDTDQLDPTAAIPVPDVDASKAHALASVGAVASTLPAGPQPPRPGPPSTPSAGQPPRPPVDPLHRPSEPPPSSALATDAATGEIPPPPPPQPPPAAPAEAASVSSPFSSEKIGAPEPERPKPSRHGLRLFLLSIAVLAVAAAVAAGVMIWRQVNKPSYPVEDLVGLELGAAQNQIATNGWEVEVVRERNDAQPAGYVFRTDPTTGELDKGEPFVLYVSDGPTPSELPDLVGMPFADAQAELGAVGLGVQAIGQRYDEEAAAGVVLEYSIGGQAVPVGAPVEKGTVIDVIVSQGPEPRTVPSLIGLGPKDAEARLAELRLVPRRGDDVFSDTVPAGATAAQEPVPGSAVPRDSQVAYVVSKGPANVAVPSLVGLTSEQATLVLEQTGLTLGQVSGNQTKTVLSQDPPAGTSVARGSAVNLLFAP